MRWCAGKLLQMSDAGLVYYLSPFDLSLLVCAAFIILFAFLAWYRRKQLRDQGRIKFYLAFFGILFALVVGIALLVSRAMTPQRQLVIHPDYFYCRSWSHGERVSWRSFAAVRLEWTGSFAHEANLRFDLASAYLGHVAWTDWVKSQGWVWCTISDVTDNPRRFAWATDANEIYNQTLKAWQAGR
jgi:hypothetical protein